jgi:hypothetical protein
MIVARATTRNAARAMPGPNIFRYGLDGSRARVNERTPLDTVHLLESDEVRGDRVARRLGVTSASCVPASARVRGGEANVVVGASVDVLAVPAAFESCGANPAVGADGRAIVLALVVAVVNATGVRHAVGVGVARRAGRGAVAGSTPGRGSSRRPAAAAAARARSRAAGSAARAASGALRSPATRARSSAPGPASGGCRGPT